MPACGATYPYQEKNTIITHLPMIVEPITLSSSHTTVGLTTEFNRLIMHPIRLHARNACLKHRAKQNPNTRFRKGSYLTSRQIICPLIRLVIKLIIDIGHPITTAAL